MKKKNYILLSLFATLALCLSGCDNNYLNVDSQETVEASDSSTVYTPEMFVNAVYGEFTNWDYGFSYLGITEIISDNADKGSTSSDTGTDKDVLDALTYTVSCGSIEAMWERWYKSIGRATQAIEYTENYGMTDTSLKNRYIGECRFLRALNYFYLVRGWGAVPIQSIDLATRQPVATVYAYIEDDLLAAAAALPLKSEYDDTDLGRATKGAAQALLAKVYLYQENWEKAYLYADSVLTSGEYSLEPDYANIWKEEYENGVESIFEFQARGESVAHGVQQYSQTQGPRNAGFMSGWGFNVPSADLLAAYNMRGDTVRRNATIIFRGETLYDGNTVSSGATNAMYNYKAYSSADLASDDTDKNIRYMRLGEVYLIKAEAAAELGYTSNALSALNTVRERVGLADQTTTDQTALIDSIWVERRLELAFEHDRWFDLNRTGQGYSVMTALGYPYEENKHELFPIPEEQILETPTMEQNPNW